MLDCLRRLGPAATGTLLPCVYDDVPAAMHAMATRSLLAHLFKLQGDGLATTIGDDWLASDNP